MTSVRGLRTIAVVLLVAVGVATVVVWSSNRPRTTWYARDADSDQTLKVLFVGNSLTYYHDMPGAVVEMFRQTQPDRKLKVAMVTGPGFKLSDHLKYGQALEVIKRDGPWDWIILQEHGGLTYSDPEEASRSLQVFAEASREAAARPVVYLDWHSAAAANHESKLEQLAVELDLPCAPVAHAWHKSREKHPEIPLQREDGVHPTAAGSYLIALVMYSSVSNDDPRGLPALGVEEQVASVLQQIVGEVLQ